jgi:hypothetical protein
MSYSAAIAVAAVLAVALSGQDQPTETAGLDENGLPPRIEYAGDLSHTCNGPHLAEIDPDTPQARTAAERACLRLDLMLNRADWPEGFSANVSAGNR